MVPGVGWVGDVFAQVSDVVPGLLVLILHTDTLIDSHRCEKKQDTINLLQVSASMVTETNDSNMANLSNFKELILILARMVTLINHLPNKMFNNLKFCENIL